MRTALLEKVVSAAKSHRIPMQVKHMRKYRSGAYYVCPRCKITMEREFMAYCNRCGQCLIRKKYKMKVMEDCR